MFGLHWLQLTEFCISAVMLPLNAVKAALTDVTVAEPALPPVPPGPPVTIGGAGRV